MIGLVPMRKKYGQIAIDDGGMDKTASQKRWPFQVYSYQSEGTEITEIQCKSLEMRG